MLKLYLYIITCLAYPTLLLGQSADDFHYDVSNDFVIPKHYIVTQCIEAPVIDGLDKDDCWKNAKFTSSFIDITGVGTPRFNTKVKMLWDENYFYVYAQMEEPHVWGNLKQRDTIIYLNNDFEVFLDPAGGAETYGEIEINALGTEWDLLLNKPYRVGGYANFHWNLDSLKTAVHVYGTINNPSDIDSLWTVEMAIPMQPLIELKNKPKFLPVEGEQWHINFSRVEWQHQIINGIYHRKKENGKIVPEDNWVWSNQKVINMHEPEKWGNVQFTKSLTSDKVAFNHNSDEEVIQIAYALFRRVRREHKKYSSLMTGDIQQLQVHSLNINTSAEYLKTWDGFNVKITNEKTKNTFVINEQGQLKKL